MEKIKSSPNFNELAGKYGTPKITIAFMINRYETWNPIEGNKDPTIFETMFEHMDDATKVMHQKRNIKPYDTPLSADTESTIRRTLELDYYDGLYRELHHSMILYYSDRVPDKLKKLESIKIMKILSFMKDDILDEIEYLKKQLIQDMITFAKPYLKYKIYFSLEYISARLNLLLTKYLPFIAPKKILIKI